MTETALRTAKAVVVLWSPRSVASRWVRAEATEADRNGTLVPATIEPCKRPIMFELTQTAELSHWQGEPTDKAWVAFLGDVRRFVGKEAVTVAEPVIAAPLPLPSKPSIAVMPFVNLSGDPEQGYFADGVMDEIVTALTRFRSVFVIASGSTMVFKGQAVTPGEAARRLGVRYVLEGSVRRSADRVRIAVKLTDAIDGAQIWAERFDDTQAEVFALQDRLALEVATAIVPTLRSAELHRLEQRKPGQMGVQELVVRGAQLLRSFRREQGLEGLALLERAVALDPSHAYAHASLANGYQLMVRFKTSPNALRAKSVELAKRAVALDGRDAEVLAYSANALKNEEVDLADEWIARALSLNEGSAFTWFVSGLLGLRRGAIDVSIEHLQKARRLDPLSSMAGACGFFIAAGRFAQGGFEEALRLSRASHHLLAWRHALEAAALGHLGRLEEGREALATFRSLIGEGEGVDEDRSMLFDPDGERLFQEGLCRLSATDGGA